jgi:hypothetical protein
MTITLVLFQCDSQQLADPLSLVTKAQVSSIRNDNKKLIHS